MPDTATVPTPIPGNYPELSLTTSPKPPNAGDAHLGWRAYFVDDGLRDVLESALANSRDLRAAVLRVAEARAAYGIQRSESAPNINAGAAATRAGVPGDLNASGRPVVGNQFQLTAGFSSWELDFWGRVRNLNEAALQNYLASDAARRAASLALIAQVADAYLSLREIDERLALAQRSQRSRAESLRIFRRRTELGAASRLELTQADLLLQQAAAQVAQLEQARAVQNEALALLVGRHVTLAPAALPLEDLVVGRTLVPGLPSELLVQRPDIVSAEHALKAARANVNAARAAFFPRIALTASAGTESAELDGLFRNGSAAWTFSPSLTLPLFDGGRLKGAYTLAEVRREQAVVRYEQAIQAAFRDVAVALTAQRWLAEQVTALRASLALQNERARLAKLRYDSGAAPYLEVLDAERERFAAEQQLVQIRRAQLSAQVALYTALGGGMETSPSAAGQSIDE